MSIAMTPVTSSQIESIGHDPSTNTLAVKFPSKSGSSSIYHYSNVNEADFREFLMAKSIGSHFIKHFKSNKAKHPFKKVS